MFNLKSFTIFIKKYFEKGINTFFIILLSRRLVGSIFNGFIMIINVIHYTHSFTSITVQLIWASAIVRPWVNHKYCINLIVMVRFCTLNHRYTKKKFFFNSLGHCSCQIINIYIFEL